MYNVIYQLALVVGLGTLAILLLRGYTLMAAFSRAGVVLIIVLVLLLFVANLIKLSLYTKSGGKVEINLGEMSSSEQKREEKNSGAQEGETMKMEAGTATGPIQNLPESTNDGEGNSA